MTKIIFDLSIKMRHGEPLAGFFVEFKAEIHFIRQYRNSGKVLVMLRSMVA